MQVTPHYAAKQLAKTAKSVELVVGCPRQITGEVICRVHSAVSSGTLDSITHAYTWLADRISAMNEKAAQAFAAELVKSPDAMLALAALDELVCKQNVVRLLNANLPVEQHYSWSWRAENWAKEAARMTVR